MGEHCEATAALLRGLIGPRREKGSR